MKRLLIAALFLALGACSEADRKNGDPGVDMGVDTANTANNGQLVTFGCYLDTCVVGREYCPGTLCVGDPAPDDAPCPVDSVECMSGDGSRFCNFTPPQCIELPASCDACDCIPENVGCTCTQDAGGAIREECSSP